MLSPPQMTPLIFCYTTKARPLVGAQDRCPPPSIQSLPLSHRSTLVCSNANIDVTARGSNIGRGTELSTWLQPTYFQCRIDLQSCLLLSISPAFFARRNVSIKQLMAYFFARLQKVESHHLPTCSVVQQMTSFTIVDLQGFSLSFSLSL